MEPGDMVSPCFVQTLCPKLLSWLNNEEQVLYESHSIIHGRPFPLQGRFYANVFLHFEPVGPLQGETVGLNENGTPPYIIPGSLWENEWKLSNPEGWELVSGIRFFPACNPHSRNGRLLMIYIPL